MASNSSPCETQSGTLSRVPPRERKHPRVLVAAGVLIDAAEGRDFMMHARIAVIRALNRNGRKTRAGARRKPAKVYRVVR